MRAGAGAALPPDRFDDETVAARQPLFDCLARAADFLEDAGMTVPRAPRLVDGVLSPPGAKMVLAEWTAEGAPDGPPVYQAPLHLHEEDEAWYVLEGTLRVRVGQEEVEVSAGGAVVVPAGTPHTYYNPRPEPARYVLVMGTRTWALIQAIHSAEDRSPDAMRDLFTRYGARLLEE